MPDSATVGTSGSTSSLLEPPVAIALSFPVRTCGSRPAIGATVHCASLSTTAAIAGHGQEHRAGEMPGGAEAGGRHLELVRLALEQGDEVRHAIDRQRRVNGDE